MNVKANKDEIAEIKDKVKDMKTYLEVMQNPVGQNMVPLGEKVKEVEKSVQEFIEDPMENKMEDRLKTITDRVEDEVDRLITIEDTMRAK